MRYPDVVRLLVAAVGLAVLPGCATLDQISRQAIGADATDLLKQSFNTTEYRGQAWNMSYEILRRPGGTYLIHELPGTQVKELGRFRSLKEVFTTRTSDFGVDAFLAPTQSCPQHYVLVIAHGNARGHFTSLGCQIPLEFKAGNDGHVYATQVTGRNVQPLAYRIGATRVTGPKPVGRLAGYPQTTPQEPGYARAQDGSMSGYRGRVWNFPYVIVRDGSGQFSIRKLTGSKASQLGQLLALRKVYSTQTDTFGLDVFATPTQSCPHQYLLVIGSGNGKGKYKSLGCTVSLGFQRGPDGRVYATQNGVTGVVPLAYVIGAREFEGPRPITQLPGYPQREASTSAGQQAVSTSTGGRQTADGLGPVPVPEQAPQRRNQSQDTSRAPPTPVTIDLGGSRH